MAGPRAPEEVELRARDPVRDLPAVLRPDLDVVLPRGHEGRRPHLGQAVPNELPGIYAAEQPHTHPLETVPAAEPTATEA